MLFLPNADSLTLQLWRDRREHSRGVGGGGGGGVGVGDGAPTKGSVALQGFLGCECGFALDRESLTLALVLEGDVVALALESREALVRWQVRDQTRSFFFLWWLLSQLLLMLRFII